MPWLSTFTTSIFFFFFFLCFILHWSCCEFCHDFHNQDIAFSPFHFFFLIVKIMSWILSQTENIKCVYFFLKCLMFLINGRKQNNNGCRPPSPVFLMFLILSPDIKWSHFISCFIWSCREFCKQKYADFPQRNVVIFPHHQRASLCVHPRHSLSVQGVSTKWNIHKIN